MPVRGCNPFAAAIRANFATMSLPGLDSGAVRVNHAWEAAAPWQVSCEEGERVYRVGNESGDGWVEVQRARRHARVRPGLLSGPRGRSRGGRRRGVSAVRGCRRRGVSAVSVARRARWLARPQHRPGRSLLSKPRRWSRPVGATHAGGVGPAPRGGRRGAGAGRAREGRRRDARRVAQGPLSNDPAPCGAAAASALLHLREATPQAARPAAATGCGHSTAT